MVPKYPTTKCANKTFAAFKLQAAVFSLKYFIKVPFSITSISWTVSLHLVYFLQEDIKTPSYYLLDRSVCVRTIVSLFMAQPKMTNILKKTKVYVAEENQHDVFSIQTSMLFYSKMSVFLRGHCGPQRVSGFQFRHCI